MTSSPPSSVLRNEDLKEMLESNKESLKLEAMKRVVGVSPHAASEQTSVRFEGDDGSRWVTCSVVLVFS